MERDDFYMSVNKEELEKMEIDNDSSSNSYFKILNDKSLEYQHNILENSSGLLKQFYSKVIEKPRISFNYDKLDYTKLYLETGLIPPFGFYVSSDKEDASMNSYYLCEGSLLLPDRDYYLEDDNRETRDKYVTYLQNICEKLGKEDLSSEILDFETKIAKIKLDKVRKRKPELYEKIEAPDFIKEFINPIFNDYDKFWTNNPNYFNNIKGIIDETDEKIILLWYEIRFHKAHSFFSECDEINFEFYSKCLNGVKNQKKDWKRIVSICNDCFGELIGEEYVKRHFDKNYQEKVNTMIDYIFKGVLIKLEENKWLQEETRKNAIHKIKSIKRKIGFPEKIKDYSYLEGEKDIEQWLKDINKFEIKEMLKDANKPVNKDEWFMHPQDINAYYMPPFNEIVFPAGILQAPFFSPEQSWASNFGGIGMVIAHEITHSIDDSGAKFDADGNVKSWWLPEDFKAFEERADIIREEFSSLKDGGVFLNGSLEAGENIADDGGMKMAYEGYKLFIKDNNIQEDIKDYFTNFARIWLFKGTEEMKKLRAQTDPHAPPHYRVNRTLMNFDEFHNIYKTVPGDNMWKDENKRFRLW